MEIKILDVKINQLNLTGILNLIDQWIEDEKQRLIATVNPEFLVETEKNNNFKEILNNTDLNTCDGFGIQLFIKLLRNKQVPRITGVELTKSLLKSENQKIKLFLLGSNDEILQKMIEKYGKDKIIGCDSGGRLNNNFELEDNNKIINKINSSGANILLVAFGQVKQETWLKNNLNLLPNIKVGIGIGGTFDYLSGQIKRAPKFIRKIGLEWLIRLITQPHRWKRIYNATIIFTYLVIKKEILKK